MGNSFRVMLLLTFAFTLAGCGKDNKKNSTNSEYISGIWERAGKIGSIRWEFGADGQFTKYEYYNKVLQNVYKGKYHASSVKLTFEINSCLSCDTNDDRVVNEDKFQPNIDDFVDGKYTVSYMVFGNLLIIGKYIYDRIE
ncbi:MAG: hypothetical protein LBL00_03315 [Endomicrobium sp.]|jgi:hypothetical protein|nr:hypothetical protein [Endomicrobium sp.]